MKPYLPYSLILAAAASSGMAFGAATAYTTPVGYVTLAVPASSDTNIAIPLQTATSWAGVSTTIATGSNTVNVAASSYTLNQFGSNVSMLQVTSGTLIGRSFPILSNQTDSVTVDPVGAGSLQSQGFANGNTFVIRPFWTLNSLFPAGAGVGQNSDPFSPTSTLFFNNNQAIGENRGLLNNYFYYDGTAGGDPGWYDVNDLGAGPQGSTVTIPPSTVVTVRNLNALPLSLVMSGTVPSVAVATLVISSTEANDSLAQLPYPVNTSLDQSQLFQSGAVSDSPDPFAPTDTVFIYDPAGTGLNPSASASYFHYDGSLGGDAGWYDVNDLGGGVIGANLVLKAGSQIVIRKAVTGSYTANTWAAPLPYSL